MSLTRVVGAAAALAALVMTGGCTAATAPTGPVEIVVGVVTSRTGPAALEGEQWTVGFQAGLAAATDGSGVADDIRIMPDFRDDASDAATAAALTQALVDEGATVVVGPVTDGTAVAVADAASAARVLVIAGSATTDDLTGRSRLVFRSGHQIAQEVAAAAVAAGGVSGRAVTTMVPDDARGQAFAAASATELAALGATPTPLALPTDTTQFVLGTRSAIASSPAAVLVRWPTAGAPQLWRDAAGTDALGRSLFTTQLGDAATWGVYGPATAQVAFLTSYAPGLVPGADDDLVAAAAAAGITPGASAADGYLAGLMLATAVAGGQGRVDGMVAALEGATFDGPSGSVTVRASDHALLGDQFRVSLTAEGATLRATPVATVAASDIAPAERALPPLTPAPTTAGG